MFVRNIPRNQCSFTWCQFGNTGSYELVRSDHQSQHKRGGVCIYFGNSLPLKILNIHYLRESISFELQVGSKICKFVSLYRSLSQTSDDFEKFTDNFELTLDNLAESNSDLIVKLGNLNIKSKNWYIDDKTTTEGAKIEFITSKYGLHQIINEPAYVLENSSSYIDFIFTSQTNLVVDSGVHPSLHPNCHHQTVYAKLNLKIHFLSPYKREKWHYGQENTKLSGNQFMI